MGYPVSRKALTIQEAIESAAKDSDLKGDQVYIKSGTYING
jgi:pectin methylesterase-like acyl-CoA thioesterase